MQIIFLVGRQNDNNNPKFRVSTSRNNSIDHRGKETCVMFGSPVQNENTLFL